MSSDALGGDLPTYHVTDLSVSGGLLTGINNYGQVVGWTATDVIRPFVWTPTVRNGTSGSVTVPDGLFSGAATDAWAINDSGQLVGRSDSKAVLWNPVSPNSGTFGQPVALAQPGGPDLGIALGINAAGQVTGNTKGVGNQAFLFTPSAPNGTAGSVVQLGTLAPSKISFGSDINNCGQVAGTSFGAFVWTPASPNATTGSLARLSPALNSEQVRVAINNSGSIAGLYTSQNVQRAFLWTPTTPNGSTGSYVDLGTLGSGSRVVANDVNDNNEVVGEFGFSEGGFVWTEGSGIKDLNTLLDGSAAGKWNVQHAYAVNNAGQIGAEALFNENGTMTDRFVLLTPDNLLGRPGDANGDGTVNFADLLILAQNYGRSPGQTVAQGDFNNDGGVGFDDLLILAQNYGQGAPATATAVPEPSASIALVAALLLVARRRRLDAATA